MSRSHRPGRRGSPRTRRLLRDLHHQTWELELLISGTVAIVLALIPARVDELYFSATAQTTGSVDQIAFLAFYFAKLTLYTLIFAFAVHIVVRAFWVSLVGLDSVFPRGVRWGSLKLGPITEGIYRETLPSIRELIVRSDAIASVIFAIAFSIVAVFLISIPWALAGGFASVVIIRVLGLDLELSAVLFGGVMLTFLVLQVPILLDRWWGDRMVGKGGGRGLGRMIRLVTRGSGIPIYGPVHYTLATHVGRRWFSGGLAVFVLTVVAFFIGNDILGSTASTVYTVDEWDPVRAGALEVDGTMYEENFDPGHRRALVPSIPGPIVDPESPWVRLFVPFLPESDPGAMEEICPDARPDEGQGLRFVPSRRRAPSPEDRETAERLLDCRGALWEVTLDGRPLEGADLTFYTRRDSGLKGIAWWIDSRELSTGRHLLAVRRSDAALETADPPDEDDLPRAYEIPFWN